ncbi:MAG: hypothetical protein HQL50_09810 [Magnetococcales bacterium]|nr:hypothetical protein [Magnetococcales bacterium]
MGADGNDSLGGAYESNDYYGATDLGDGYLRGNAYIGGTGDDTLTGTTYSDTYRFELWDGDDTIIDQFKSGWTSSAVNNSDEILFDSGEITIENIILEQSGSNLVIRYGGGGDQVTVQDWYTDSRHQVEEIETVHGDTLLNTQVDQLIQAMATFTANQGGISWEQAVADHNDDTRAILTSHWQQAA